MNNRLETRLFVAWLAVISFALPAGADELADSYTKLAALRGAKYAKARDDFVELPEVAKFLGERIAKSPEDWLAVAILARTGESPHARAFDKIAGHFAQSRGRHHVGEDFDERAFWHYPREVLPMGMIPLRDPMANAIPQRYPSDGIDSTVPQFDWMVELALELEWAVVNPEALQTNHRAGVFFRRIDSDLVPEPDEKNLPRLVSEVEHSTRPYERKSLATFDGARFQRWLAGLRDGDYEGFVRATAAVATSGPESKRTLQTLSREDSFLGAFAALAYSARATAPRMEPPFDAEWLEDWIRRARGHQLRALEDLFLGDGRGLNPRSLAVPPIVSGLVLKHHAADLSSRLKQVYAQAVDLSLRNFLNVANIAEPDTDPDSFTMHQLLRTFPASPLWPKSASEELASVQGTNPKILEYVKKAKAQLGEREYPRADDLQAMFGPAKK